MSEQPQYLSRTPWARYGKRPFDVVVAGLTIAVLSPLYLLLAVAVKLTSPGPVFFSQVRTGRDGVPFHPRKFRSMRAEHRHDVDEVVPLEHAHVTALGRFFRRFKLDELPQLFSVFVGEMSLIGPRPTIPEQTAEYDDFQRRRLLVRPGVTGLAQVNCCPLHPWDERIKFDVYYAEHHGFWLDMGILLKTVVVILLGEQRFDRPFADSPYARRDSAAPKS